MPDETALNDNTEKRLYDLSAWCPCLSPHNLVISTHYSRLSSNYLFIPAPWPCLPPHNIIPSASFPLLSVHYQLISAHLLCLSPHNPALSTRYSCLSSHYPLLSTHYLFIPALWLCLSPHNPALSTRYSSLSLHNLVLSTHYLFIPAHFPLPFLTQPRPFHAAPPFHTFPPPFLHTTSSFPRGPSIPHIPPSLSPHNLLLSARFILLSTAVTDVARLILPPVLPSP